MNKNQEKLVEKLGIFKSLESLKENQNILYFEKWKIFLSYNSVISINIFNDKIYLNKNNWDYSRITGKYRNIFLEEKKKETEIKLKNKEYLFFED